MRFFQRGETVPSKFTFIDSVTLEEIDIDTPTYRIVHYDHTSGAEVIDVPDAPLIKIAARTGEYICNWLIPMDAAENETYFVTARGTHPVEHTSTVLEDFYRVLPAAFFAGGSSSSGLVIKFTKA
jgi:hypothetical protein